MSLLLQSQPRLKHSTVYRQLRPTTLDKIKNLQVEVRFGAIRYGADLTPLVVLLKYPGGPGRYAGAFVVCDPRWT